MFSSRTVKCNICDDYFVQNGQLKVHKDSFHERKKPFWCNNCEANFAQNGQLKVHRNSVIEGKKPLKCKICDVGYTK